MDYRLTILIFKKNGGHSKMATVQTSRIKKNINNLLVCGIMKPWRTPCHVVCSNHIKFIQNLILRFVSDVINVSYFLVNDSSCISALNMQVFVSGKLFIKRARPKYQLSYFVWKMLIHVKNHAKLKYPRSCLAYVEIFFLFLVFLKNYF